MTLNVQGGDDDDSRFSRAVATMAIRLYNGMVQSHCCENEAMSYLFMFRDAMKKAM